MNAYSHEFESPTKLGSRRSPRLRFILAAIALALLGIIIGTLTVFYYQSEYEVYVDKIGGVYRFQHEDGRSTNNYNYLIKAGGLPEKEELALYRQFVRDVLTAEEMEVPSNIFRLSRKAVDGLIIDWYQAQHPETILDEVISEQIVEKMYETAIKPAVDRKTIRGPEDEENIWRLVSDSGQPKLRWVGEDGDFISWLIVYSAGDKRSFYDPITNTIYLSSTRSIYHLADELSHAEQFRKNPWSSYIRFGWSLVKTWAISLATDTPKKKVYAQEYLEVGSFEHEAHSVIKPLKLKKHNLQHLLEEQMK